MFGRLVSSIKGRLKRWCKPGWNPGDVTHAMVHVGLNVAAVALGLGAQLGGLIPPPWGAVVSAVCLVALPIVKQYVVNTEQPRYPAQALAL